MRNTTINPLAEWTKTKGEAGHAVYLSPCGTFRIHATGVSQAGWLNGYSRWYVTRVGSLLKLYASSRADALRVVNGWTEDFPIPLDVVNQSDNIEVSDGTSH